MESEFDLDIESLHGFVSDSIMNFLTDDVTTPLPVNLLTSTSSTQLNLTDEELDELFLVCNSSFEQPAKRPKLGDCAIGPSSTATAQIFAPPKTEQEIQQARIGAIPKKTQSDTKYCIGMWDEWRYHRLVNYQDNILEITEIPWPDLSKLLSRFILEARKKNGDEFPPSTLHHIISGLQRYLRLSGQPELDFFKNPEFAEFRADLDAEMKRLQ